MGMKWSRMGVALCWALLKGEGSGVGMLRCVGDGGGGGGGGRNLLIGEQVWRDLGAGVGGGARDGASV